MLCSEIVCVDVLNCSDPREKSFGPLICTTVDVCAPSTAPSHVRTSRTLSVSLCSSYCPSSMMLTGIDCCVCPAAIVTYDPDADAVKSLPAVAVPATVS